MKKVLVIVEGSYAKNNGVEVSKQYVAIDSKKLREGIIEEWFDDVYDDVEGFINGNKNSIYGHTYGDWDDPTGHHIYITSKEDAMKMEKEKYDKNLKIIEQLFQEETKHF